MPPKVALVHDWLVSQRGGEAVLETLVNIFPDAPIFTLVSDRDKISERLGACEIRNSFLQTFPGAGPAGFRKFLPLFPRAVAGWDFSGFDLVVSTSHCVAKAAGAKEGLPHISYVHTPMRYIWDQWEHYAPSSFVMRGVAGTVRLGLQHWDMATSRRDSLKLIANSQFVAERISRVWKRDATVVHPPVDADYFFDLPRRHRSYWCIVSALVPYKRVELAVDWANQYGRELIVVGDGPEKNRLERLAGPTVRLLGRVRRHEIRDVLAGALGLIFPGIEDFGIVPLEAMAAGVPVVAFKAGGALETVRSDSPQPTGVFFDQPKASSLEEAVSKVSIGWEKGIFEREALKAWAATFSTERFESKLREALRVEFRSLGIVPEMI